MSAISNFLTFLRSAIYAIDVRDGIADAIEQCYNDVNNPTLKTEALEAALQNKIDQGEMAALTIGDHTITAAKLASGVIDNTLSTSGAAADAAETGRQIGLLKADLDNKAVELKPVTDRLYMFGEKVLHVNGDNVLAMGNGNVQNKALMDFFDLMKRMYYGTDEGVQYVRAMQAAVINDASIKYVLTSADFEGFKGNQRGTNIPYPFSNYSQYTRETYTKFDLILETGKTYRILVDTTRNETASMGLQIYDNNFVQAYNDKVISYDSTGHVRDDGWRPLIDEFTLGESGAGLDEIGIRITVRPHSTNGIYNDFKIKSVIIQDVSENVQTRDKRVYILTDSNFRRLAGNTRGTNIDYPFWNQSQSGDMRCSYIGFDLILDTGKTYKITIKTNADTNLRYGLQIYDYDFVKAYREETTGYNSTGHVRDPGWIENLTGYQFTLGRSESGLNEIGVRLTLQARSVTSIDDFKIYSFVIEEV